MDGDRYCILLFLMFKRQNRIGRIVITPLLRIRTLHARLQMVHWLSVVRTLIEIPVTPDHLTGVDLIYTTVIQRGAVFCDQALNSFKLFFIKDPDLRLLEGERTERLCFIFIYEQGHCTVFSVGLVSVLILQE